MKRFLIGLLVLSIISSMPALAINFVFPRPQGYVSDYADILDRNTRLSIENIGRELQRKTGVEIAVVVVKTTLPYDYLEYANRLFASWQIGQEGQDNGVLLLLSLKDKKVRVEVGYGVEEILTEKKIKEILNRFVQPKLKDNQYSEAVYNGALAAAKLIGENYNMSIAGNYYPVQNPEEFPQELLLLSLILLTVGLALLTRLGVRPPFLYKGRTTHRQSILSGFGRGFGSFGGRGSPRS